MLSIMAFVDRVELCMFEENLTTCIWKEEENDFLKLLLQHNTVILCNVSLFRLFLDLKHYYKL